MIKLTGSYSNLLTTKKKVQGLTEMSQKNLIWHEKVTLFVCFDFFWGQESDSVREQGCEDRARTPWVISCLALVCAAPWAYNGVPSLHMLFKRNTLLDAPSLHCSHCSLSFSLISAQAAPKKEIPLMQSPNSIPWFICEDLMKISWMLIPFSKISQYLLVQLSS